MNEKETKTSLWAIANKIKAVPKTGTDPPNTGMNTDSKAPSDGVHTLWGFLVIGRSLLTDMPTLLS